MSVGAMKDQILKLRNLHASHDLLTYPGGSHNLGLTAIVYFMMNSSTNLETVYLLYEALDTSGTAN